MGLNMDIAAMLGDVMNIGWFGGMLLHFVNGAVIFPMIYVLAIHRLVPPYPHQDSAPTSFSSSTVPSPNTQTR
jgi:hypothetical protein